MPAMDYAKVAALYDAYAQAQIDVPFFIQEAQGCRSVLELTSGTGRLSIPLIRAGVPLSCLDSSAEMLAVLRRKLYEQGLSARVYEMDASNFSLAERFDLILIPFNSFAEITDPAGQAAALACIRAHLAPQGRWICTLHNPAARLKGVDGQVRLRGKFSLPGEEGVLFLSSYETYDAGTQRVKGAQFYEIYSPAGELRSKRYVDLQFCLPSREAFEQLALAQGFRVEQLYGDYERAAYDPEQSPFMIWVLRKDTE